MSIHYSESFDALMKTYCRIYPLDSIQLYFLSDFSDEGRKVVKYSIDVEKACDSHYKINSDNAKKLSSQLLCDCTTESLANALADYFSKYSELDFVELLENSGVEYQPFHYDDYDIFD